MTKEQFTRRYSRNSNLSEETLKEMGFEAEKCACGEDNCQGWRMVMEGEAPHG